MTTLVLVTLLALVPASAPAQEPDAPDGALITSSQIAGLSNLDELSPGLRGDISALVGTPVNRERLTALATRIEGERPEFVAAVRAVTEREGEARVVFMVARVNGSSRFDSRDDEDGNVNARYTVESVDYSGIAPEAISQALRDDFQKLVGQRLQHDVTEPLLERLHAELPDHDVTLRTSRGTERGTIRVTVALEGAEERRWFPWERYTSKVVFHRDQRLSTDLNIPMGGRDTRGWLLLSQNNRDNLVEENDSIGFRLESRKIAGDNFGAGFEVAWFDADWRTNTRAAVAARPQFGLYDRRFSVAPTMAFAFNEHVRVTGGVSINQLDFGDDLDSQTAGLLVVGLDYAQIWRQSGASHAVDARISVRSTSADLAKDFDYTRYLASADYRYRRGPDMVIVRALAGRVNGTAPLFERFTLGDTSTLRGWDKYDIVPAGGDEMWHTSAEFRHDALAFFVDTGAVNERGADQKVRVSAGVGAHRDNLFATLGIPLNRDTIRPTLMFGVRF